MKKIVLSALAVASLAGFAGSALGQTTYGTVQFRWRERALGVLPIVGGAQTTALPAGAVPATPNVAGLPATATDANFHLILEAFVTADTANPGARGLNALPFSIYSSGATRTQGNFVSAGGGAGDSSQLRNNSFASNAAAQASYTSQGLTLPGGFIPGNPTQPSTDRGLFAAYRDLADLQGANQPAVGVQNLSQPPSPPSNPLLANSPSMENVLALLKKSQFTQGPSVDPDTGDPIPAGPYYERYDLIGQGFWVPVYYTTYQLTDFSGRGQDTVTLLPDVATTWRGLINPDNSSDAWRLATGEVPTFVITIPAPGSAALLGLGGLVAARRRRTA